jgi:hypothetical protein
MLYLVYRVLYTDMVKKKYAVPFKHGTTTGKFGFVANEDAYKEVLTNLGVEEVSDTELKNVMMNLDAEDIPVPRVVIHYALTGGKKRSARLFYDPSKPLATIMDSLLGTAYKTGTITAVNSPRRRVYQ